MADGFGFSPDAFTDAQPEQRVRLLTREAALFATRCVVEMAEVFAEEQGRELLVLLSFGSNYVKQVLDNEPLFDQSFLDWLGQRQAHVVDLRDTVGSRIALLAGSYE